MIRGQDVPRPSTLYCRKAPSRHALPFPLLLFFGLTRFVNVQCCAPLDHACSSAFIVCVCVCLCVRACHWAVQTFGYMRWYGTTTGKPWKESANRAAQRQCVCVCVCPPGNGWVLQVSQFPNCLGRTTGAVGSEDPRGWQEEGLLLHRHWLNLFFPACRGGHDTWTAPPAAAY